MKMLFVLTLINLFGFFTQFQSAVGAHIPLDVWPHPQYANSGPNYLTINSNNFEFIVKSPEKCELLDNAVKRTKDLAFIQDCSRAGPMGKRPLKPKPFDGNNPRVLTSITVEINRCEHLPHLEMNENYTLGIDANNSQAYIGANTVWGAIRALETFSQLVERVDKNQFRVIETEITDFPRFSHRGLMVDTSRHYIPLDVLQQNLDAMAYNKLNVFHWHIVDEQSFPFVSHTFPNLSLEGAYDSETHVYTAEDVQNVVEYGRQRGIRVVVEFDTPGHTRSWGKSQKGLLTECYTGGSPNGEYGPIDPTKDSVYEFLEQFFSEVTHTFPDQYFHLGGDEVDFGCWESNPDVRAFMAKKKIETYPKLQNYYMERVLKIIEKFNKSYIIWEEVFNNGAELQADTVVNVWIGSWGDEHEKYWRSELNNVTKKGYRAILSSCWYLDLISYGADWRQYYQCEPLSFNGTPEQNQLVIGGSSAVWSEYVNGANLISRTWPRAMAMAERLWSPKHFDDPIKADKRFRNQNCLMIERGLKVQPNDGPGYCQCDYAF